MGIVLYGAGDGGINVEDILFQRGIAIKGFLDTYKKGRVCCKGKRTYPILELGDMAGSDESVIVTIANQEANFEVTGMLKDKEIKVTTVEELIYADKSIVEKNRSFVAEYHMEAMDDYFDMAEHEESLNVFWGENSVFFKLFQKLNVEKVVELACGRGRHVPRYMDFASEIMLVDVLQKNIDICKRRFCGINKISYCCNNGTDLRDLKDESYTSLFSYDSMVHFELLDIFGYLKETYRILENGGRALFHHSNNDADYRITFSNGTSGRNYMSKELFAYLANRAGLSILEQYVIDWGDAKDLDCISLVEKAK